MDIYDNIEIKINELEYFQSLYSNEVINFLVDESNAYYRGVLSQTYGPDYSEIILQKEEPNSAQHLFITKGITRNDILAYIGIRTYMSINQLPTIEHYWKEGSDHFNKINKVMTKDFYVLIGQVLNFPENNKVNEDESRYTDYTKIGPKHKITLFQEIESNFFPKK